MGKDRDRISIQGRSQADFWFACVDIRVIQDRTLGVSDKAVYAVICAKVDVKSREYVLSVGEIAEMAGVSVRTAQRSIQTLLDRGVLQREDRFQNGKQLPSTYRIVGHNAECYQESTKETCTHDVADAPNRGDKSVMGDKNVPPMGDKNDTPKILEPKNQDLEPKDLPPTPRDTPGLDACSSTSGMLPEKLFLEGVIDLYNQLLPELPPAERLTESRAGRIRERIRAAPESGKLSWWRWFFLRVREFPHPMGHNPSKWRASLDWLLDETGMQKILEGTFTRDGPFSPAPPAGTTGRTREAEERQARFIDEEGFINAAELLRSSA